MTIAKTLYQLQQVDEAIRSKERRLAEVKAQLGESRELRDARTQLEKAEAELRELEKTQRVQELELQTIAEKIESEERRLYSGRLKNPKELAGLQKEVRYLKGRRTSLEDELLETMMAREEAAHRVMERQATLAQIESNWEREQATLAAEQSQLQTTLTELRDQRTSLVSRIPAHALNTYDYLHRTKGFAVALLEKDVCTGCQVGLSAVDRQRVQTDDLVTCSNCGRILVIL